MIAELARNGRETARVNYGARGWVAHHNADLWRQTAPVGNWGQGDPKWANWPMGAVWHSMHLWEHYAFTRDAAWLRDFAWPLLRGAAEFALDWLVPDGKGGLATAPSISPENDVPRARRRRSPRSRPPRCPTWRCCASCSRTPSRPRRSSASTPPLRREMEGALARLPPYRVGARGQLQEWSEDFEEPEPHHRHVSHLIGLHPGRRSRRRRRPRSPGGAPLARAAGRRQHRLVDGLEGQPVGSPRRRRPGAPPDRLPAPPRRHDGHELRGRGRRLRQPLRRPPAVPDRRQLRRDRRRRRDARAVAPPRPRRPRAGLDLLPALPSAWPAGRVSGLRPGVPSRWTSSGRAGD